MRYPNYQPMIDAAGARPALWRLILGAITAIALTLLWFVALVALGAFAMDVHPMTAVNVVFGAPADTPARSILFLLVVAGLGFATLAAARIWNKRKRRDLIGYGPRTLRHFLIVAGLTLSIAAIFAIARSIFGSDPPLERNLPAATWLTWLPFALLAIALQTGAEELFFRGYLQSQLAARFRSPLIWLGLPAIAFGFPHVAPGFPAANSWLYVGFAALFGILAGDLTARTGSLGAAWGWHFANNTFALLFIASEGSVTGLGYWRAPGGLLEPIDLSPWLLVDFALIIALWLIIRRVVRD